MSRPAITSPTSVFGLTWLGQLVSSLGTGLTSFAVMVHVYRSSESITQYSLASFFSFASIVLVTPIAGGLVDRWDRRRVMLLSDVGAGCAVFVMWLMVVADAAGHWKLQSWHFYLPLAVCSGFSTFRGLAYSAATTLMVPKQHLGRANGMIELALGIGHLIGPVAAGFLVLRVGIRGILLVDLVTYLCCMLVLWAVRFPQLPGSAAKGKPVGSLKENVALGWAFIRERPGLIGMLRCIFIANLFTVLVTVLITPMVLSFADAATLGGVVSFSGVGMLTGGVVMGIWGGPRRRILGVLGFQLLTGVALFAAALPANASTLACAAFVFMFASPAMVGNAHAIWQVKVPPEVQGRVFAVRRMVTLSAPPVAALLAGPLADGLFEPAMAPSGALADSVGRVLGTGPGRGIALLFVVLGALAILNVLLAWLSPRIRNVEEELPDALRPEPATAHRPPHTPGLLNPPPLQSAD
ncbi:MFS transporter [Pyxidicoccus trucidator]|uniref:MFS transporter n=1 Tax=Pyxidicoccus trucidator TaxID=2709662 RepID=UPI001F085829|nr:MFS transporter [Pyxidicoccus trucidator]